MTYEIFTKEVLERFPEFRKYLLKDCDANEVDLLPSNLSFSMVQYYDKVDVTSEIIKDILKLLEVMRVSGDEDLIMLYNETVVDISNTKFLKQHIDKIEKLVILNPSPGQTHSQIMNKVKLKKDLVNEEGEKYEESNRKLIKQYSE